MNVMKVGKEELMDEKEDAELRVNFGFLAFDFAFTPSCF